MFGAQFVGIVIAGVALNSLPDPLDFRIAALLLLVTMAAIL